MTPARVDAVPSRMHMAMRVGGIVTSTFIVASGFRFSPAIIRSLFSNSGFPSYVRTVSHAPSWNISSILRSIFERSPLESMNSIVGYTCQDVL